MDEIRAIRRDSGENVGTVKAIDITSNLRNKFNFACLNPNCDKGYLHIEKYSRKGHITGVKAHFKEDLTSEHVEGCAWDFQKAKSKSRPVIFEKDGHFHIRLNFPLGGHSNDNHLSTARINAAKRTAADNLFNMPSQNSMENLVKFIEKKFGSLEAEETSRLKLYYQGEQYAWNDIFIASDNYTAHDQTTPPETDPVTGNIPAKRTVVQILGETKQNAKDKRRFLCQWQQSDINGKADTVRPIITCETDAIADAIAQNLHEGANTMLIAARPFVRDDVNAKPKLYRSDQGIAKKDYGVTLYVKNAKQITAINEDQYWRDNPKRQKGQRYEDIPAPRILQSPKV
jgi:hypothetical protein